jgi:hypothetical protein
MGHPFKRCSPYFWSEHMDVFSLDLTIFLVRRLLARLLPVSPALRLG